MADPRPRFACVDAANPEAWGQCDRCGFWYNVSDLAYQFEWAGQQLYDTGALVCVTGNNCYDTPNEQLRTIILPPDPPPIINARPPSFGYEEQMGVQFQFGGPARVMPPWGAGPQTEMCTQDGQTVITFQWLTTNP